jgi:hypothetical protein
MARSNKGHGIQEVAVVPQYMVASVTPTLDTAAYATGDSLSAADLDFTDVVDNNGGSGRVKKLIVVDNDAQAGPLELWLFTAAVSPAAANAAHSITDGEAATCVGVISVVAANYFASALNAVAHVDVDLPFVCASAANDLFGVIVSRSNKTYTASGLTFKLLVERD